MKRVVLALVLMSASAVFGQQKLDHVSAPAASVQPTRAEVLKMLELMRVREQMDELAQQYVQQMQLGARADYLQEHPKASEATLKKIDAIFSEVEPLIKTDDLMQLIVPLYQKNLSRADVQAITAFYASPAGKHLLDKSPVVMREAMQASAEYARAHMEQFVRRVDARMKEIQPESQQPKK
jgi:hypothetical protein